jgi:hypothetical protein
MKKFIFSFLMLITINFVEGQSAAYFLSFVESRVKADQSYDEGIDACDESSYSMIGTMLCKSEQYWQRKIEQDSIIDTYNNCDK